MPLVRCVVPDNWALPIARIQNVIASNRNTAATAAVVRSEATNMHVGREDRPSVQIDGHSVVHVRSGDQLRDDDDPDQKEVGDPEGMIVETATAHRSRHSRRPSRPRACSWSIASAARPRPRRDRRVRRRGRSRGHGSGAESLHYRDLPDRDALGMPFAGLRVTSWSLCLAAAWWSLSVQRHRRGDQSRCAWHVLALRSLRACVRSGMPPDRRP